jgi:transcriptional regulator with XRE-family HTH domain
MMHGSLPARLQVLRARQGLTLIEAAEKIGIGRDTLSDLERGNRHPVMPTLAKIAQGYGVPVEELLEEPQVSLAGKAEAPEAGGPDQRTEEEDAGKLAFDRFLAEEHRAAVVRALRDYMRRRAEEYARQLEDQENPHFRSASAANLWLEILYGEMRDWGVWAYVNRKALLPDLDEDTAEEFVHATLGIFIYPMFALKSIARKAERRIEKMTDEPNAIAERRKRAAKEEAETAERQLDAAREQAV